MNLLERLRKEELDKRQEQEKQREEISRAQQVRAQDLLQFLMTHLQLTEDQIDVTSRVTTGW